MMTSPVDLATQQKIAAKIDSFVEKDPKRVVDLWKRSSMVTLHLDCIKLLDIPKDKEFSLLDAGCGVGHICETLPLAGYPEDKFFITGFDLSSKAIKEAKKNHPDHDWICGSFLENYPEGKFDYVFSAGPMCYYQGQNHWEIFDFQLKKMMESTSIRGVSYVLYTDKPDWKPLPNYRFVRYHPDEVRRRYPKLNVFVDEERVKQHYGSSFADLDMYFISW